MKVSPDIRAVLLTGMLATALGCARRQPVRWDFAEGVYQIPETGAPSAPGPVEPLEPEAPALPPFEVQVPPLVERDGALTYVEGGIASWYRESFGRRTASGERYDRNALTAAHRTLPFGAQVRVRNLENGREVVVRINDRGPFVRGRIIDLSEAAAQAIGIYRAGLARVEIEVLEWP